MQGPSKPGVNESERALPATSGVAAECAMVPGARAEALETASDLGQRAKPMLELAGHRG